MIASLCRVLRVAVSAVMLSAAATGASAAEVKMIASNAVKETYLQLLPQFGQQLEIAIPGDLGVRAGGIGDAELLQVEVGEILAELRFVDGREILFPQIGDDGRIARGQLAIGRRAWVVLRNERRRADQPASCAEREHRQKANASCKLW